MVAIASVAACDLRQPRFLKPVSTGCRINRQDGVDLREVARYGDQENLDQHLEFRHVILFDKPDDKSLSSRVPITVMPVSSGRIIGTGGAIFGPAIAWCAGAWAVGNLVIADCPSIGIGRVCVKKLLIFPTTRS